MFLLSNMAIVEHFMIAIKHDMSMQSVCDGTMGQLQLFLITAIKHRFANVHNNRIQTTNHRMNEFRGEHSL